MDTRESTVPCTLLTPQLPSTHLPALTKSSHSTGADSSEHCPPTPPTSAPDIAGCFHLPSVTPQLSRPAATMSLGARRQRPERQLPATPVRKSARIMDRQARAVMSSLASPAPPPLPQISRPRRRRTTQTAQSSKSVGKSAARSRPAPPQATLNTTAIRPVDATRTRDCQPDAVQPVDDADGHFIIVCGTNLTPRYKILRQLGQGTFGKVVECWDRDMAMRVAVKIIRSVPKYRAAADLEIRVLRTVRLNDPHSQHHCIQLYDTFEFQDHICMVFELLSCSVFDFLKANHFQPFPLQHVQSFALQLLQSVAFLHRLNIVHTDLKPENILLVNSDSKSALAPRGRNQRSNSAKPSSSTAKRKPRKANKVLMQSDIRLIDFGSAAFEDGYHSHLVSTRHYRAPEVVLGLGWSFPCDMWSIGCILLEFLTGDALFQTHDNIEHLAMMEKLLGPLPDYLVRQAVEKSETSRTFFHQSNTGSMSVRFPDDQTTWQSVQYVMSMPDIRTLVSRRLLFDVDQSGVSSTATANGTKGNGKPTYKTAGGAASSSHASDSASSNQENRCPMTACSPSSSVAAVPSDGIIDLTALPDNDNDSRLPAAPSDAQIYQAQFCDLIFRCLEYDPRRRLTAAQALQHPFFSIRPPA